MIGEWVALGLKLLKGLAKDLAFKRKNEIPQMKGTQANMSCFQSTRPQPIPE